MNHQTDLSPMLNSGMPVLMVEFPDGSMVPYWNTFYQEVITDGEGKKHYLGQMDLIIQSPKVTV